jgi:hypothetical protein
MLEYWNAGKLGKEKMTQCIIAKIARGNDVIKWTPSFTNPTFQYSTIPLFHGRGKSPDLNTIKK